MGPEFRPFGLGGFIRAGDAPPTGRWINRECFWRRYSKVGEWLGKVQGAVGGSAACVAEIRWRWRVQAEGFVDGMD